MSDNAEHLEEDQDDEDKHNSPSDTNSIHLFSCVYCATGLHDQCRGTEHYRGTVIHCECYDAGHVKPD